MKQKTNDGGIDCSWTIPALLSGAFIGLGLAGILFTWLGAELPNGKSQSIGSLPTLDPRYERAYRNLDAVKEGDYLIIPSIWEICTSWGCKRDESIIYEVFMIRKNNIELCRTITSKMCRKEWRKITELKESGYRILLEKDRPN